MGLGKDIKGKYKGKIKGKIIKVAFAHALIPVMKILLVISFVTVLYEGIQWLLELIRGNRMPEKTYDVLDVSALEETVEIKGNPDTGYYINYKDGFDQKVEELAEEMAKRSNYATTDPDVIEKMIRAQLITQYPNLGGEVGGEDDGKEKIGLDNDNTNGGNSEFSSLDGFLFIGDSITNGLGQSGNISNATFHGSDSSTPTNWLNNEKSANGQATYDTLPDDNEDIKALCVMLGTNNVSDSGNMEKLIDKLHKDYPNKTIFVQKILPLPNHASVTSNDIDNYNSKLEEICNERDYCILIDATSGVELADNIHPSQAGYKTLAENIKKEVTTTPSKNKEDEEEQEEQVEQENKEEEENLEETKYEGFQGSVKIRRVTPDKEMGKLENVGSGVISLPDNSTLKAGTALETKIKKYIDESGASGNWSVYAKNLATNKVEININDDKMESASLIKLFIMATTFEQIQEGRINRSDVEADIQSMITVSDNDATNRLIDKLGFDKINRYIENNGYTNTKIGRKMLEESSASKDNYTCVSDVSKILEKIYKRECVDAGSSEAMLSYLKNQQRTGKIPAGVPDNVQTANKTGELDDVENDAAIVFKEKTPYILVVMSGKLNSTEKARKNIVKISSLVYEGIGAETTEQEKKEHIVVVDAGHGDSKYAGSYEELATNETDLQNGKKYYTQGTTGKAIDGSIWKEHEAVQKVVAKVKELMEEQYPTIKIIQTGKNEPNFRRIDNAKEAGAEAYIGVHLNSNDNNAGNGSEVFIKPGSGNEESAKFGKYIVDAVHNSLNIKNNGVNANLPDNTKALKTSEECGFPNIYIKGAYMNSSDMKVVGSEEGLEKYAQGIVDGIAKYFGLKDTGEYEDVGITKETEAISSQIYDLSFVPTDVFNKYVSDNDVKALKTFTLDKSGKLITAKWSYNKENGIKIIKNSPINFRSVLTKYVTTYEYLLDYWIDIKEEDFILAFANKVLESEFIITLQDNVSTTQTTVTTQVDINGNYSETSTSTFTETVSNEIELSYVDTWFVKFSKDYDFSDITLSSANAGGVAYTGTAGESLGDFRITAYCPCAKCCGQYSPEAGGTGQTSSGTMPVAGVTVASNNIAAGTLIMFNEHIYRVEDTGSGLPGKWIDLFMNTHEEAVQWGVQTYPVFLAENVTETSSSFNSDRIVNATASVPGKVTETQNEKVDGPVEEIIVIEAPQNNNGIPPLNGFLPEGGGILTEPVTVSKKTTVRTSTHSISNKYDTGEGNVSSKEEEFVKLFESYPDALSRIKPRWLVRVVEENAPHMTDLTKYLMNVLFEEELFDDIDKDKIFEMYEDNEFKKSNPTGVDISLTDTVLDKETFVEALQAYYDKTGNLNFKQNFLSRAEEIYDLGKKYNVNPELIVTMALKECGFKSSGGNQNFWGLGTPNGASLAWIGSFEEGVQQLASSFEKYMEGSGTWHEGKILSNYEERMAADCNSNGYGLPGTLKGMLSIYSDLCGENTKHREGDEGDGGNYYLKVIYGDEFDAKCGSIHQIGVDDYTIQERADYTAWLYENQIKYWNDIFGDFATLGGTGDIRAVCEEITQMLIDRNARYGAYTYNNIQKTYESDPGVVCSSYTALVLYKSGLMSEEQLNGYNYHYTVDFPNMLVAAGWVEVDKSDLLPGDVLNKPGEGSNGHTVIYIGDGLIYDQTSAVWGSGGVAPTGKPKSVTGYLNGYTAWRKGN